MTQPTPSTKVLSEPSLRDFASRVAAVLAADLRFSGLLAGGSAIAGNTDAYSDLDLVLVVREDACAEVLGQRRAFAETLGPLLYAFTGEHVGEPRLLRGRGAGGAGDARQPSPKSGRLGKIPSLTARPWMGVAHELENVDGRGPVDRPCRL